MVTTVTYNKNDTLRIEDYTENVNDGIQDFTGLEFIGTNLPNYGLPLNQNFITLTENFYGKSILDGINGQIWFDPSDNILKIKNGEIWENINNIFAQNDEPSDDISSNGNIWIDTSLNKIQYYYNNKWNDTEGHDYDHGNDIITEERTATNGTTYKTMEIIVNNKTMIIISGYDITSWIPNSNETVFDGLDNNDIQNTTGMTTKFPSIKGGVNLNKDCNNINFKLKDDDIEKYINDNTRNTNIPLYNDEGFIPLSYFTVTATPYQVNVNNLNPTLDTRINNRFNDHATSGGDINPLDIAKLIDGKLPDSTIPIIDSELNNDSTLSGNNIQYFSLSNTNNTWNIPTNTTKILGYIGRIDSSFHNGYSNAGTIFIIKNINFNTITKNSLGIITDTGLYIGINSINQNNQNLTVHSWDNNNGTSTNNITCMMVASVSG